jgi:hypothetical protein
MLKTSYIVHVSMVSLTMFWTTCFGFLISFGIKCFVMFWLYFFAKFAFVMFRLGIFVKFQYV